MELILNRTAHEIDDAKELGMKFADPSVAFGGSLAATCARLAGNLRADQQRSRYALRTAGCIGTKIAGENRSVIRF